MKSETKSAVRSAGRDLASTLTSRLEEALAQAETTDFRALDRALFEGLSSEQLDAHPRDELHRQLVFALAETVLTEGDGHASDWIPQAVHLFLARLSASAVTRKPAARRMGTSPLV